MKIYALLIGVNRYDTGIGALKCAAKDARKLESLFDHRCRFQTRYLEQEDLHSGVVEQAIEQAGKELAGGGVFVFYFSGHGKQQGDDQIMLLPGAKRDLLEKGLTRHSGVFSYQTLRAMTSGWKGVRRLFIFDACRAMLPTKSGDMQPAFEGIGIRRDPGMANKTAWEAEHDFTELNSCGPGQASLELPEDKGGPGHGVFTLALLESLNTAFDDQRPVCVDERFVVDLRTRMAAIAERHGERLCGEPTLYGEPVILWEGRVKAEDVQGAKEADRMLWEEVSGDLGKLEAASDTWRTEEYREKAKKELSVLKKQAEQEAAAEEKRKKEEHERQAARIVQEDALWSECSKIDKETSYQRYLAESELHRYESEAKSRLAAKIKEREDTVADRLLWEKVSDDLSNLEAMSDKWRTEEYRKKGKEGSALRKLKEQEAAAEKKRKREEAELEAKEATQHPKKGKNLWLGYMLIVITIAAVLNVTVEELLRKKNEVQSLPVVSDEQVVPAPAEQSVAPPVPVSAVAPTPSHGTTDFDPVTGMEFVYVNGGCYHMGDTFGDGESDEKPEHEVCVSDYWLGMYEVKQGEWEMVMGNNPSEFKKGPRYPVENVSWDDAQEFIKRLNKHNKQNRQSGREYQLPRGREYRLPTEAEWEYAAREGGKKVRFGTGKDTIGSDEANFDEDGVLQPYLRRRGEDLSSTVAVGRFAPNGLGLYDMSGNVWEWCSDRYGDNYYAHSPRNNPQGPSSSDAIHVSRGGGWGYSAYVVRATMRGGGELGVRTKYRGFRLALPAVH